MKNYFKKLARKIILKVFGEKVLIGMLFNEGTPLCQETKVCIIGNHFVNNIQIGIYKAGKKIKSGKVVWE